MQRSICPACKSKSIRQILREDYTAPALLAYMRDFYGVDEVETRRWLEGKFYEVMECTGCGLCFQTYYPDPDLATQVYDKWIDQERSRTHDLRRSSLAAYSPILQEVVALADYACKATHTPLAQLKILDYGMGWGSWLRFATALGMQAYGFEVSPERIAHAESLGIRCIAEDELPAHKFDIINLEQVLEHVPDPADVVAKLLPSLKEDGLMKISVPNGSGTASAIRKLGTSRLLGPEFVAIRPLEHVNSFTPAALRRLVGSLGLKVRRGPVLNQLTLISSHDLRTFARSIGRPLVRGLGGFGTSLVLSR